MDAIRGAMSIIGEERLTRLLVKSIDCIQNELVERETMPEQLLLETLADALTSLEYYIESMANAQTQNDALLKLSEESLTSIGYATES
jgi:thioredoxin-related protein